ncbi:MAG: hypothetical protein RIQ81_1133 [Pseudomonadota bacterium]|jgi:putative membrane protein
MVNENQTSNVPVWLRRYFSPGDAAKVEAAIKRVETATAGELVVALARRSSGVGHVAVLTGSCMALLAGEVAWMLNATTMVATGVAFLSFILGFLAGQLPFLQRFLTTRGDLEMQVFNAAAAEFLRARISHTSAATGVLIYVSFMEHRVVVLGDHAIASKVQQSDWDAIVSTIVAGLKSGKFADGLTDAVHKAGTMLSVNFPPVAENKNELHNDIRYLD